MNDKQKIDFKQTLQRIIKAYCAHEIEWMAFVIKTDEGRIAIATEKAPKSVKL